MYTSPFHPGNLNYRYPASHNPYWKKILNEGLNTVLSANSKTDFSPSYLLKPSLQTTLPLLLDHATEAKRGQWRETFGFSATTPLHVELGCNAGHVLIPLSRKNSTTLHIGVDWKFKALYWAAEKAMEDISLSQNSVSNLYFFRAHSERLPFMFGPSEISSLALYFPDPWEKPSQKKHRFFHQFQLERIAPLVCTGGTFYIKTDHDDYFRQMIKASRDVESLWSIEKIEWDLHRNHPHPEKLECPEVTLFEKLFIKQKIPIKSMWLKRN